MIATTEQLIISGVAALGLNTILSSWLTLFWQRRSAKKLRHEEYKEARYMCIILLMHGYLFFESAKPELIKRGYENLKSEKDLWELLWAEYINSYLYASDEFIASFIKFIMRPEVGNLHRTALAVRKDLWGRRTKIKINQAPPPMKPPSFEAKASSV